MKLKSVSFEKLYSPFDKKDYFGHKQLVKNGVNRWREAVDTGKAGKYASWSEEDVKQYYIKMYKNEVKEYFDKIRISILNGDVDWLKKNLRYSQKFTIAAFEALTGIKLPSSTNAIHAKLDQIFVMKMEQIERSELAEKLDQFIRETVSEIQKTMCMSSRLRTLPKK